MSERGELSAGYRDPTHHPGVVDTIQQVQIARLGDANVHIPLRVGPKCIVRYERFRHVLLHANSNRRFGGSEVSNAGRPQPQGFHRVGWTGGVPDVHDLRVARCNTYTGSDLHTLATDVFEMSKDLRWEALLLGCREVLVGPRGRNGGCNGWCHGVPCAWMTGGGSLSNHSNSGTGGDPKPVSRAVRSHERGK